MSRNSTSWKWSRGNKDMFKDNYCKNDVILLKLWLFLCFLYIKIRGVLQYRSMKRFETSSWVEKHSLYSFHIKRNSVSSLASFYPLLRLKEIKTYLISEFARRNLVYVACLLPLLSLLEEICLQSTFLLFPSIWQVFGSR